MRFETLKPEGRLKSANFNFNDKFANFCNFL